MIVPGMEYPAPLRRQSSGTLVSRNGRQPMTDPYRVNGGFCDPLREGSELFVEHLAPFSFLLLHLYLVFVTVPVLALAVPGLVELDVRCLSVELYILTVRTIISNNHEIYDAAIHKFFSCQS